MLYDQRCKRSRQSMSAVPRAPASSRPATTPSPLPPLPLPLVRAHAATSRFLDALPRHSRHDPVWRSHLRVRSVLTTTRGDQERVLVTNAEADASRSPRSSFTATDTVSMALMTVTASDEPAMVYLPPTPFETQERADVRKLIRHAHRARKLLLDRLMIVNLRRNHRCELMEEIARLKKVLASLQEQVDTTTRNVATMDRLVLHLQSISSIFTDVTQVPDATALPVAAVIPTEPTTEATALTPDAEPTRSGSRNPSQSPRSSSPGVAPSADDPRIICAVEEEKEESPIEEQQREKEQNRERRQKEEEEGEEEKLTEAQVKEGVFNGDACSSDREAEEEDGREVSSAVRASPRASEA